MAAFTAARCTDSGPLVPPLVRASMAWIKDSVSSNDMSLLNASSMGAVRRAISSGARRFMATGRFSASGSSM